MAGAPEGTRDPYQVQQKAGYKYLGIWMADDLTSNKHVEKVALPKLLSTLGELRCGVANVDVLSPSTAMAIVRSLAVPLATYGSEVWARIGTEGGKSAAARVTQKNMDKIDHAFRATLRGILGVRTGTNTLAVWRELGWMGLDHLYVARKTATARSLMKLGDSDRPKQLLLWRLRETSGLLAAGGGAYSHKSIGSAGAKGSYFAAGVLIAHEALGSSANLEQEIHTGVWHKQSSTTYRARDCPP
jgi:hypothetical protein